MRSWVVLRDGLARGKLLRRELYQRGTHCFLLNRGHGKYRQREGRLSSAIGVEQRDKNLTGGFARVDNRLCVVTGIKLLQLAAAERPEPEE
ncbi:hypothetical protein NG895_01105 [Aeoliella sp. ICT_H6.2]|uniref:Uncharacterized protein n=1 Tax=Aeoliella straminimaris TaxID=2954799 RepID=A0A9X2JH33_9BACT|nr:hypothetical protein [Aeoliella straminimaris]MCO6042494.1 hypothetical protein [Aeoliella straminimaris]